MRTVGRWVGVRPAPAAPSPALALSHNTMHAGHAHTAQLAHSVKGRAGGMLGGERTQRCGAGSAARPPRYGRTSLAAAHLSKPAPSGIHLPLPPKVFESSNGGLLSVKKEGTNGRASMVPVRVWG